MKSGSTVALITPFIPETGEIDFEGVRKLLRYHVASGTDNLCILGTTAEASVMSMEERGKVLSIAVEECKGKLPILVGTGTINPNDVKAQTLQAMDLGCDASLVVTPYYVKPPQRALVNHMVTAADYGLPVVVYNVPGRTGIDMTDESIAICAEHENVVAVKDATGNLDRVDSMRKLLTGKDDFLLLSGDDGSSLDFLKRGGDGFISVTANLAAKTMQEICVAVQEGRLTDADNLNKPLVNLHQKIFLESNPMPTKWAASKMGLINSDYCRPPLDTFDPSLYGELEQAMKEADLL